MNISSHTPRLPRASRQLAANPGATLSNDDASTIAVFGLGATAGAGLAGWGATEFFSSATATGLTGSAWGGMAGAVTGLAIGVTATKDAKLSLYATGAGATIGAVTGALAGHFGGQPALAGAIAVIGGVVGVALVGSGLNR